MKTIIIKSLTAVICLLICAFPAHAKKKIVQRNISISLEGNPSDISRQYGKLDYGLRFQVRSEVDDNNIVNLTELPTKDATSFPSVVLENSLVTSTEQYLDRRATALGFDVSADFDTDYILSVTIKECKLRVRAYNTKHKEYRSSAAVLISWELLDSDHQTVIGATTSTGHATANSESRIATPLSEAYFKALDGIDWSRIAPKLKIAKNARMEKNKMVTGKGDTALESTVIRWYITSTPQGADVTWRVVSSTPDVKNTNGNYVGNTPYESTESFDIQGLTYNNSGNVQIEVSCDKSGYIPQKKRFNLRQVIDQKEISAKFNLVREDE